MPGNTYSTHRPCRACDAPTRSMVRVCGRCRGRNLSRDELRDTERLELSRAWLSRRLVRDVPDAG